MSEEARAITTAEFQHEEERVEERSKALKKELGLGSLVLTQILFIVGLAWVGVAGKLGPSHIIFWLLAIAFFYIPSAIVVIHLNRLMPLEGGLYQWAKLGFSETTAGRSRDGDRHRPDCSRNIDRSDAADDRADRQPRIGREAADHRDPICRPPLSRPSCGDPDPGGTAGRSETVEHRAKLDAVVRAVSHR